MNILVTGALGHIGSKLIRLLRENKKIKKIFLVDNLTTNKISSLFFLKKKFNFYDINLLKDYYKISKITKRCDIIIHLAALTNAELSLSREKKFIEHNLNCSNNIFKIASYHKKKIIFISSTSVYGSQKKIVYEDDNQFINPQSPYAIAKIKEEKLLFKYGKEGLNFIILRFGTIHGFSLGMRFHTAVNKFIYQGILNQNITVWKTAMNQRRPYLSLNDGIRAIEFIIEKNIFDNQVYNVLNENYTVRQILSKIKKKIKKLKVKLVTTKIMNQLSYDVSNKKFLELGFRYNNKIENDINETINALKGIKNNEM
jgi:nucleoside-diphosphate-sugar epimerase